MVCKNFLSSLQQELKKPRTMSNSSFVCPVYPLHYSPLGLCFAHMDILQINSAVLSPLSTLSLQEGRRISSKLKKKSSWTNMVFLLDFPIAPLELEELIKCIPIKCVMQQGNGMCMAAPLPGRGHRVGHTEPLDAAVNWS